MEQLDTREKLWKVDESIKMIIGMPFLNPPLDNIKASELKKVWDWQTTQIKSLIKSQSSKIKQEMVREIEKIGVDLGEGRVLDIAWSDLKQNIITIINNIN